MKSNEFLRFIRRVTRHRLFMIGFIIVLTLIIVSIFAPWFAPKDPFEADFTQMLADPGGSASWLRSPRWVCLGSLD